MSRRRWAFLLTLAGGGGLAAAWLLAPSAPAPVKGASVGVGSPGSSGDPRAGSLQRPKAGGESRASGARSIVAIPTPTPAVQNDPRAPDYDPFALARIGLNPHDIFKAEPRDPVWAADRERSLDERIRKDLMVMVPQVAGHKITCGTLSCEVVFELSAAVRDRVMGALQLVQLGPAVAFVDSDADLTHVVQFNRDTREAAGYDRWYTEHRRRGLARARATPDPDLPVLPE